MDRKFSINSIALGNIRRRRGRYLLLIAGIVLAIYFVSTALFFADTLFTSLREQHYSRLGEQDAIIFNCGGAPLEELVTGGILSEYGVAEILACVLPDGESRTNSFSLAHFDDTALALARKEPLEGRLPEKPGEIALERTALARLRSKAGLGDRITLTLLIPDGSAFMEEEVQKDYTLVGVLGDELTYLEERLAMREPAYTDYPAGVLAAAEQIEAGGRAVVNCYGIYSGAAGIALERLQEFCLEHDIISKWGWPGVEHTRYRALGGYVDSDGNAMITTTIFFVLIALVLVCAACLGIINAFAADLESRRRQIGLIRALGATQKQIRAIFGREAIFLALCAVPAGLVAAALTVWGVTGVLGDSFTFRPNVLIVAGIAAAGVLCVRLAAAIPLRSASRIPPMQAIRDVGLSRRLKRSRTESRAQFDVPRHMARRSQALYRNKQAGITAMLALSIVLLSLAVFAIAPALGEMSYDFGCDFSLRDQNKMRDWLMEYDLHRPGITEQDKADAAALATVEIVTGEKTLGVKIITDRATPYIIEDWMGRFEYLSPEPPRFGYHPDEGQWNLQQYQTYLVARDKYGYSEDFLTVDCCGADAAVVNRCSPFVSQGRIDMDRLNSGEEILIIAPAEYALIYEDYGNGSWDIRDFYRVDEETTYSAVHENDMFRAGDAITISLLYCDAAGEHPDGPLMYNDDGSRPLPDEAVRIDRTVTIGAILEPEAGEKHLGNNFSSNFFSAIGNIITTTAGLQALGFDAPYSALAITLSESPDGAMEEYLETNLEQIAARTAGTQLTSHVALAREQHQVTYGLLIAVSAIMLLFFAICASMINNALSARIRAGRRGIGTLRAVGASNGAIERSYRWQLLSMFTWGTAAGLASELAICSWIMKTQEDFADFLPIWQPLLFVALLFGICLLNIRSRVGSIFRSSIVENIREL